MFEAYVAAGLDPSRFWTLTPRLLSHEFRGAAMRQRRERELVWFGAMLPHLKDPVSLDRFLGSPVDEGQRVRRFHEAWDRIDGALKARDKATCR